jgi:dynein intermediate chain 2
MCFKHYHAQCVSVSTDGQILWWDTRKLSEPTDSLLLCTDTKAAGGGQVKITKTKKNKF